MREYDHTAEQEQYFVDSIKELERVNREIAELTYTKKIVTDKIISSLHHKHEGTKSYEYKKWVLEVKTPVVYSFNKKMYESGNVSIPKDFNPIKKSVSYSIDKRLCEKYIQESPKDIRDILIDLIEKKPGKASVSVKELIR